MKLISAGSTAMAGASVIQSVAAAYLLTPDSYYMAMSCSSATATFLMIQTATALELRTMGVAQQATALPLPATFTLAAMAQTSLPLFGICSQSVI